MKFLCKFCEECKFTIKCPTADSCLPKKKLASAVEIAHTLQVKMDETVAKQTSAQDAEQAELNEKLLEAASDGEIQDVRTLLDRGADVNAKDKFGRPPLYQAALCGHTETVQLLLGHGARVYAKDKDGKIPRSLAESNGHQQTAEYLGNAEIGAGCLWWVVGIALAIVVYFCM